ncbi:hypothetical protein PV08_05146 [Exophiala spinifera]|uniref:Epoxide hydrolase N-terminal domain-containing protein n=1 Tax=Exophiala spinifera TaxID=91928 RepID=A0A0D1YRU2_9EURO|nr:uncharacterized protein PV08_05146 [Exophiala spinifera]KIW17951.1 hypothetical protein PV08_05146 [Exophiala spinifera]
MASVPGSSNTSSNRPERYRVAIPEDQLNDLKSRLARTKLPDELEGSGWNYGVPLSDIRRLIEYWKNVFDWRIQEQKLNLQPHFHAPITVDGGHGTLDIHFTHWRCQSERAIPLLFIHGWPGHFSESSKMCPLLTDSSRPGPKFHVVSPSLPNFGFSQAVSTPGFGIKQYAEICHKLMKNLGYHSYVTQGGDWGFTISRAIGMLYPESCRASHINMVPAKPPTLLSNPWKYIKTLTTPLSRADKNRISRHQQFLETGTGYSVLQSTKPQTLAYALADSPVALTAWIWEKLHDWSDNYPWTDDEILTWVSIYWFSTAGPGASLRIYFEFNSARDPSLSEGYFSGWVPEVKYGVAHMPGEIVDAPSLWTQTLGDVIYESEAEYGGHFAAWENPEFIAEDVKNMFKGLKESIYS